MAKPISRITIVGGGTAGWMSALFLTSFVSGKKRGQGKIEVTLIESPSIPTVGVGEATVPGMPRLLKNCGISEERFFKTCNASFKLGVLFDRWNNDAEGRPIGYVNPFARAQPVDGLDPGWYFLRDGAGPYDFVQTFSPSVDLWKKHKGPRPIGAGEFDQTVGFAYHLDAGKFAGLLREVCAERGVKHILDDMVEVEKDEHGYISAIQLRENGRHDVELVIDCTGFRGLIINQALDEPFISYSKYLANDRAMAVQLPHPDPEKLEPMTRSTALGAGWSWRVPLYNRIGTGYVFSSAHRSDEEAMEEFRRHLAEFHPAGMEAEPRVIPMRVGRTRRAWVKNCVAIGLTGGFIEPLESTAIYMIEMGLRWLLSYFPNSDYPDPIRDRYNKVSEDLYAEVRDFICLHYALNNRTDTDYWNDVRGLDISDGLAGNIELWKHTLPTAFDLGAYALFSPSTYGAVLLGKRVYETGFGNPDMVPALAMNSERWKGYLAHMRGRIDKTVAALPDHRTLLTHIRGEAPAMPAFGMSMGVATVPLPGQGTPIKAPSFVPDDEGTSLL